MANLSKVHEILRENYVESLFLVTLRKNLISTSEINSIINILQSLRAEYEQIYKEILQSVEDELNRVIKSVNDFTRKLAPHYGRLLGTLHDIA